MAACGLSKASLDLSKAISRLFEVNTGLSEASSSLPKAAQASLKAGLGLTKLCYSPMLFKFYKIIFSGLNIMLMDIPSK